MTLHKIKNNILYLSKEAMYDKRSKRNQYDLFHSILIEPFSELHGELNGRIGKEQDIPAFLDCSQKTCLLPCHQLHV